MATPATPVGKPQQQSVSNAREQLLEKIRGDKHLPTLGVALSKVIEITSSNDDSIADLARYILADVALTQQNQYALSFDRASASRSGCECRGLNFQPVKHRLDRHQ